MTATSCDRSRPRHKMWARAIGVDMRRVAGVGWCGTKATRPADPVSVTTGGSTGHLERRRHASPSGRVAQDPAIRFLRAVPAEDRGCAVIPAACAAAPMGSGAKSVLQMLWSYASRWRPGDGPRFVWPSVETIADKLGRKVRGVYANLATLEREGWIVRTRDDYGRKGWDLHPTQLEPEPTAPEAEPDLQLGIAWPEPGDTASNEAPACAEPVERESRSSSAEPEPRTRNCTVVQETCTPEPSSISTGVSMSPSAKIEPGREMLRIFHAYEQHRVSAVGGPEARRTFPASMHTLWTHLGGNAKALRELEAYGRRRIDIAAKCKAEDTPGWQEKVRWCSDGDEWKVARYKAVMAWQGAAAEPCKPTPPPQPDPIVDDARVDFHERDAFAAGGADAVRKMRREALSPDRLGELAGDFLAKLRTA